MKLESQYTRAETIRSAHDTIRYGIRCTRYDTFRDTFAILTWEAEACDTGLRSVSRCSVFVMNFIGIYWLFLWYLVFVSNFGMCYICTVSYRIVLRAYRDTYRSLCMGDIPVCRCIVSALEYNNFHWWKCIWSYLQNRGYYTWSHCDNPCLAIVHWYWPDWSYVWLG